jgi:hypothetical protein
MIPPNRRLSSRRFLVKIVPIASFFHEAMTSKRSATTPFSTAWKDIESLKRALPCSESAIPRKLLIPMEKPLGGAISGGKAREVIVVGIDNLSFRDYYLDTPYQYDGIPGELQEYADFIRLE